MKNKHELLAPAGNYEKAIIALNYGADAIYIGPKAYSLRARASNFDIEEIELITKYAHENNKKVYVVLNIICRNAHVPGFANYFKKISECKVDGIICADPFIIKSINEIDPNMPIHISTQQSISNSKSALFWKRNNAERVVLAREVDYSNLEKIVSNTKDLIEIEYFIHGAVCISYSGRCTMSNNFSYRDSNVGGCAHSCRWNYKVSNNEKKIENFTMSAKDMNLIEDLNKLLKLNIASFKIEGRMKSVHYIATIVSSYKKAIDEFMQSNKLNKEYVEETKKAENRLTSNAYFDGNADYSKMLYSSDERKVNQNFAFIVDEDLNDNCYLVTAKNNFNKNYDFECISYNHENFKFKISEIINEDGISIDVVVTPMKKYKIKIIGNNKLSYLDIIRISTKEL
ncbi:MAG: peptidase U32 family protein [Mycoplasmoidaceae bacterium]